MHSIQAPAGRLSPRLAWLAAALAALALTVTLVAASGGGSSSPHAAAGRSDLQVIGAHPLQQASCTDWLAGSADERAAVIAALKRNVGGPPPSGPGTTLSDQAAYALFDRTCMRPYAAGFLLYELYTRSAAFSGTPEKFQ